MENAPTNKTSKRILGDHGEEIACKWYMYRGYEIVDRNVAISRVGEIDIIASSSGASAVEIVFIEVKTRRGSGTGFGYEAVSRQKRIRMRNCAMAWIDKNVDRSKNRIIWRLDVVSIDVSTNPPTVSVFENIEV